jgi:phosphoribosylformylglycinamidine synthase subunit PurL
LIACPDLCSRAWIWDQYDSTVGGMTVKRPGTADAAVVKLDGCDRALALTTDCTPRYCAADPESGGRQAVAEAWRNLTAVGARPLAITDNMNFGNPEKPEVMGQFAAAIRGMAAACEALDFPVVSGNVSLYNETEGRAILPTPAIGGLGVLDDAGKAVGIALPPWLDVVLVGATKGWLGQSLWLREITGREEGAPPPVDLPTERANGDFVRAQILAGTVRACHDVSDGGILVALAEMAMAGNTGARVFTHPRDIPGHAFWFGEDQGRYLLAVPEAATVIRAADAVGIPAMRIATSGGQDLTLPDGGTISVPALRAEHERFLPMWLDGT